MKKGLLWSTLLIALSCNPAPGQALKEQSADESRAFKLAGALRCPVCQSETVRDSQSASAREMLVLIREMIATGRPDADILAFFQQRYGDFVLIEPPPNGAHRILWYLPVLILLLGVSGGVVWLRSHRSLPPPILTRRLTEGELERLEL
jgi:cytochrome c-type biogenesis protein CcmH